MEIRCHMITLPEHVYLRALNKRWNITYVDSPGKLIMIEHHEGELAVYGKNYAKRAALLLIIRWTKLKAHDYLINQLIKINRRVNVRFKKVIVRSHEWQWGSYSSTKTMSLNYKLIFLPPTLVKHLIIHELCHIRYLEHSPTFWHEVSKYDKNWKKHRKALEDANDYIPDWVI